MTLEYHGNLFERGITCTLTDSVDSHLSLASSVEHTAEGVGCGHTEVVVAVGGDDGIVHTIHMLHKILDLGAILRGKTIACGVGDIYNSGTSLDDCLYHTGKILIVGTSGILGVELHVLNIFFGILDGSHRTLDNLLAVAVKLILDVGVARTDTCVNTLVLGIF